MVMMADSWQYVNQFIGGVHRESAREHCGRSDGGGRETPSVFSRGDSLQLLFMLTAALLVTSSHSEGTPTSQRRLWCGCRSRGPLQGTGRSSGQTSGPYNVRVDIEISLRNIDGGGETPALATVAAEFNIPYASFPDGGCSGQ